MAMIKIREDKHGPYIKCGGYIFRPIHPAGYDHVWKDGTAFDVGSSVPAHHIAGSPRAWVGDGANGNKEQWHSHGAYMGNPNYNGSESCYKPEYENWPEGGSRANRKPPVNKDTTDRSPGR